MQIGPYRLKNKLIVAPMAGVTDRPFRQLCKRMGAAMAVSEMVSSFGLHYRNERTLRERIGVIVEADGARAVLMVDELVGQQQVVVKSLEANFRKVAGLAGATVMGDGSVALILDVPHLVRMSGHQGRLQF